VASSSRPIVRSDQETLDRVTPFAHCIFCCFQLFVFGKPSGMSRNSFGPLSNRCFRHADYVRYRGQGRPQLWVNEGDINDNKSDNHCNQAESEHVAHVVACNARPCPHFADLFGASPPVRFFVFLVYQAWRSPLGLPLTQRTVEDNRKDAMPVPTSSPFRHYSQVRAARGEPIPPAISVFRRPGD
jgi:hypothetical protein